MQRKKELERLIRSLVEAINSTIRRSGHIRDLMKEIEQYGYDIHLSLLAGIVLRDKDEAGMEDLTDIFSEDEEFDPEELELIDEDDDDEDTEAEELIVGLLDGEIFTDEDRRFLISLGLSPE